MSSELATGGVVFASLATAQGDGVVTLGHIITDLLGAFFRCWDERQRRVGVEEYEVDFARDRLNKFNQRFKVVVGVIYAVEQDVFEGNAPSPKEWKLAQGVHEVVERPFLDAGHQPVALFLRGGVQGYRQVDTCLGFGQCFNSRNYPCGRDGDAACGELEAVGRDEDFKGGDDVVEVQERFAHAHEDEVRDPFVVGHETSGSDDLVEYFVGGQVALEAAKAGDAKGAGQCAADLAGYT